MVSITYSTRPVASTGERHEESLLDDAIDDTFPASDSVSLVQPGSIVNVRYAALEHRARRQVASMPKTMPWRLLVGAGVACAMLLVLYRRQPRGMLH